MEAGTFDKRLLILIGASLAVALIVRWALPDRAAAVAVAASADSIPLAEKRLDLLRQAAATVPGRQQALKHVQDDLAVREKGLLKADTMQQAQAQLLDIVQNVARANGIDSHGVERLGDRVVDADYGEVWVEVAFTCAIEQLVNTLASLADQPQILSTNEIRVNGGTDKKKNVQVRLTVAAPVPRKLIPEKKGAASF